MQEEHIILRLPDVLRTHFDKDIEEKGYPDCEFDFRDPKNAIFKYKGVKYQASVISLPCIIESQKTFDGQQFYKTNDVTCMIAVWPKNYTQVEINHYTKIYSASGITPPLKFVKYRRWRERSQSINTVEETEKKVNELLERDKLATSIRIQTVSGNQEDDVSSFAAELENNLIDNELSDRSETEEVEKDEPENAAELRNQIRDIQRKIEEKKMFLKSATNIIVQKRFEEAIKNLTSELVELQQKLDKKNE